MMQAAQEDYTSKYSGPPEPDPHGVVPPFPTPDKKDDIYNAESMNNVDNDVMNVSGQNWTVLVKCQH
jgi:hypothetical protein